MTGSWRLPLMLISASDSSASASSSSRPIAPTVSSPLKRTAREAIPWRATVRRKKPSPARAVSGSASSSSHASSPRRRSPSIHERRTQASPPLPAFAASAPATTIVLISAARGDQGAGREEGAAPLRPPRQREVAVGPGRGGEALELLEGGAAVEGGRNLSLVAVHEGTRIDAPCKHLAPERDCVRGQCRAGLD